MRQNDPERWSRLLERTRVLIEYEERRGEKMFLGVPDRWLAEGPLFRCTSGHVSSSILKSEEQGDLCLACRGRTKLTYPEDYDDGPLPRAPR